MDLYSNRLLDGRFKLRHLRLVLAIAENGTMAGAARELFITQPVVTRGLREAEELLDVELFVRGPRGVAPTSAGELLIEHARVVLSTLVRLADMIEDGKSSGVRPVRIGVNMTGSAVVLPRALVALKRLSPAIKVSVFEGTDESLRTRLRHNELDLVVGRPSEVVDDEHVPSEVQSVILYEESIELVVRNDHEAANAAGVEVAHLVDLPWVLPPPPTAIGEAVYAKFIEAGLRPPRNLVESNSIPVTLALVTSTDAIAPLPASVASTDRRLAVLPLALDTVPREVGVTFMSSPPLSDSAKLVLSCLRDVAGELGHHPR